MKNRSNIEGSRRKVVPEAAPEVALPIVGPWWLVIPFLFFCLTIFLLTMCPTVPGGDSGELITVSYILGVAHPPGYPLYTMLGHMMTYLPMGSVAWRVNFLSAIIALLNIVVLVRVVERWLRDRWLGLFAAGMFIFSPLVWRYNIVAEVFSLNNLFIGLLILATQSFIENPTFKRSLVWTGVLGLACSHHHTIVMLALPIFLTLLAWQYRLLLQPKVFLANVGIFLAGFLPYLYLPFASKKHALSSWGATETWDGFWTHFLRREYGTFQLATGDTNPLNIFSNLKYYALDMWEQFLYVGILLVVFSLYSFAKNRAKEDRFGRTLLIGFLFYVIGFHALANMDLSNRLFYDVQSRFWMMPNMILCLFCAYGLGELAQFLPKWREQLLLAGPNFFASILPKTRQQVVMTMPMLAVALQVGLHYQHEDQSKNTLFHDLGKSLVEGVPANSLIFMRGDVYVNAMRYVQDVEGIRRDVKAIPFDLLWWPWMKQIVQEKFPDVTVPGKVYRYKRVSLGDFTLRDFFDANFGKFPVYIGKLAEYEVQNLTTNYKLVPIGYLNKIVPLGTPFDFATYRKDVEGFNQFKVPQKDEIRDKSWEAFVYYNFWDRELEKSKVIFTEAAAGAENIDAIKFGAQILERMVAEYAEVPPAALRNLGVAYQILSRTEPVYQIKMVEAWKKYLATNPENDPSLPTIRMVVQGAGAQVIQAPPPQPAPNPGAPPAPPPTPGAK